MFTKLGRFVVHNPWKVIAAWVVAFIVAAVVRNARRDVFATRGFQSFRGTLPVRVRIVRIALWPSSAVG